MAINPHHTVEELNGVRCSIVEKKVAPERTAFLQNILENNGYSLQIIQESDGSSTIGVTDLLFNIKYALYSRKLKTSDGQLVTPSIWYQQEQKGEFYWNY